MLKQAPKKLENEKEPDVPNDKGGSNKSEKQKK